MAALEQALDDKGRGEIIRNGLRVALLGSVNAGKSTALNALAGRAAAIVSDEAGTTRDIVEVRLDLDGVAVILQDTAGIRDEAGHVESIGIERAKAAAAEADLVILMADLSQEAGLIEAEAIAKDITVPLIKIANKRDLADKDTDFGDFTPLSLHDETDCDRLETLIAAYCKPLNHSGRQIFITRERHRLLVQKAADALAASMGLAVEDAPELVAEELRIAADALGQMTGHIDVEDILGDIFSSFCIGK
jgi:tRNA modification GTPase